MGSTYIAGMFVLLVSQSAPGQALNQDRFASLDSVIRSEMQRGSVPGVAVAVVHGKDVVFARAYGVASVETAAPMTVDMLFSIGSITKMLTAATVLSLVEDGIVDLHVPVDNYLPDLPPKLGGTTLDQLLSHTGGLRDGIGPAGIVDPDALPRFCGSLSDSAWFHGVDSVWSYSNVGYALAGCVVEAVQEAPFAEVVAERVLDATGMAQSTFDPLTAITRPLALGHRVTDGRVQLVPQYRTVPAVAPAGALLSSLADMARFATALVNEGQVDGRQVLPERVVSALLNTWVPATDAGWGATEYGYGMFSWTWHGQRFVGHQGLLDGFGADLVASPEQQFAVVILANREAAYLDGTKLEAMRLLLPPSTAGDAPPTPSTWPSDADAGALVGSYGFGAGDYVLSLRDGRLWLRVGTQEDALTRIGPGVYRVVDAARHSPFPTPQPPRINFFTLIAVRGSTGDVRAIQYAWRVLPRVGPAHP